MDEGIQTECSWIPNTPAKPGIAKKQPICEDNLENQSFFTNWLSLGPTPQPTQADTTDCLVSGAESVCRDVSLVYPDFYNEKLMLLTDAATSAAAGHRDVHVEKIYNASVLHYQEARATHATIQTESLYSSWVNEISILPESRHEEGNASVVNEDPCSQSSVHLAPITPSLTKESNKEGSVVTNFCLANKTEDCIAKEADDDSTQKQVAHDSCELQKGGQSEPPDHISCPTASKTLQENHEPDMGSNQHVHIKTPQRKPKRKKHRPKVISNNQPKLNSRTTKLAQPQKSTRTKRKHARNNTVSTQGYTALNGRTGIDPVTEDTRKPKRTRIKRNGINQQTSTPAEEDIAGTTSPKTNHTTRKSCRRSLNFDSGTIKKSPCQPLFNLKISSTEDHITSTRNLGKGLDDSDLTQTPIKYLEDYMSMEEIKTSFPSTPSEYGQLMPGSSNGLSRICQTVFSNTTPYDQCDARNSNTSDCRSILTYERRARGRKRGRLSSNGKSNFCSVNAVWAECSYIRQPIELYEKLQTLQFPTICKKKRAQRIHKRTTSSMLQTVTGTDCCVQNNVFYYNNHFREAFILSSGFKTMQVHCNASSSQSRISTIGNTQLHQNILNYTLFLGIPKPLKKRRSKGLTRPRDLASLSWCTSLADGSSRQLALQKVQNAQESQTCREALVAATIPIFPRKRRSNRYVLGFPDAMSSESLLSIDAVIQQFSRLDIAAECNTLANLEMSALVAYHYEHPRRNILVNQIGWTMISFDALNDHTSQRRARPKVDIDEETTRVWKLLLEDINNEGIDGTDEEKRKKWQVEREVFRGRANSFIAKMRLVQGDRRFCPWKGSVVDSVVGVFLTQNVSDHLSSSAFMSMAAKFPLKKSSNNKSSYEGFIEKVNQWHLENLSVDDSAALLSTKHSINDKHDFFKNLYEDINSTDDLRSLSSDSSECDPSMLTEIKISGFDAFTDDDRVIHLDECQRPLDDVLSSQNSIDSPGLIIKENQLLCTNHVLDEKTSKRCTGTSFAHLLQMQKKVNFESTDVSPVMLTLTESEVIKDYQKSKTLDAEQISNDTTTELTRASTESETIQPETMAVKSDANSYRRKRKRGKSVKSKRNETEWDNLRKEAHATCKRDRTDNTMDSVDWETVRCTEVGEIAETIKERGMNNMLAERIKDFLNRLIRDHGSIDLEWLRDVPPDKAKEYLLSIRGLGLKSVECVRLLTLHHVAFPVDTNVGRIAVRLGWVPLQPLPESLQLHLLELYPVLESIQKYLWPRLCKLNQRKLYELHYQMITFGKVFCTKNKPNCNACPMRGECRHFASAYASARLALPAPADKSIVTTNEAEKVCTSQAENIHNLQLPKPEPSQQLSAPSLLTLSQLTIEVPADSKPIIEEPDSPELGHITPELEPVVIEEFETETESESKFTKFPVDMEDVFQEIDDEIPTIDLNIEALNQNLQNIIQNHVGLQDGEYSKALVVLNPEAASIPVPKLKNINRLRTEHQVYVIPDSHELLNGLDRREINDPSPYLLAIWSPGETINTVQPLERRCKIRESGKLCYEDTCFTCNSIREDASQTVRGTILIPCRTAMRGSFPLNGTYFQVNEVFADHESSLNPINVPRDWLWNLRRRTVYFGTSIPTIFKGLGPREIQHCFWRGFVCVRGFDRVTRGPRPLIARLHFPASKLANYREAAES